MRRVNLCLTAFLILVPFLMSSEEARPCVFICGGFRSAAESELGNAFESMLGFSAPLAKATRVIIILGTAKHSIIAQEQGNKVFYRSFHASPFLVGLQRELFGGSRLAVYVTAGGGVLFSGLQDLDIVTIPETIVKQTIPAAFALRGAAGAEVSISANFRLFGEAGYLYGRTTGKTQYYVFSKLTLERQFSLDLSAFDISLGMKYYF